MAMEILERPKRGRRGWKNRATQRDESAQPSAFPSVGNMPQAAAELQDDAAKKEAVRNAAAAVPEIFTAEQVIWAFDVYVGLLCLIYSYALKTDFDALQKELEFTQEQKELMAKPLAKICSKYAPPEWAGKTDEIQLITMLGVFTVTSYQRARKIKLEFDEKKKDAERTRPVQPIKDARKEIHVPA